MGAANYMIAVEAGGRILHNCSKPLDNGPSLPSVERTLANLGRLGHTHRIDTSVLPVVARRCSGIARQRAGPPAGRRSTTPSPTSTILLGGMTGTLKAQLAQFGMTERLNEVLEEVVRVRAEFGHSISANPFSQLIGIQSVLNIVTGDRYSVIPDEMIIHTE